jgi:tetratricopeptide (TPR) repeat protein
LLEGNLIENKLASHFDRVRRGLSRYRGPILVAGGILLIGGIGFLYWSQKKAQEYDEAFRKGLALWNQRQAERALVELRKAAQADPRDPELWVVIGRAEMVLDHADRALQAWEQALRREPGYKPALFERGKEALGRHVARRIPPPLDVPTGWLSLRVEPVERAEGGTGELQRILADLKEGAGHAPEFAKFARGASHLLEGRYRDAQPPLQAYSDLNGWDAAALAILGIDCHYGALPSHAERALSEALAQRNEKLWFRVRAEARYLQGNYEGARADYREAGLEKEAEPLFARRIPSRGLILWLSADAGVEVTGASVSRWKDQSEGRHDGAPKEAAGGPRVTPSAVHGRPAVLFGGKDDELILPEGFEDFSAGLSVFVVGEPQMEPSDPWSFLHLATAARGAARVEVILGRRRESEQIVYSAEDLMSKTRPFVAGIVPAKGFEGISAVQESSGTARLYKRGTLLATETLMPPRKTLRTINRVGAGLKGQLAEVLLYNRSLSELERLGVEAYLKDRYFPDGAAVAPSTEKR